VDFIDQPTIPEDHVNAADENEPAPQDLKHRALRVFRARMADFVPVVLVAWAVIALIYHYALGLPWRSVLFVIATPVTYIAVYASLARLQRRGARPYRRPAWYVFVPAGIAGGLVSSGALGEHPIEGIFRGMGWCAFHYAVMRWIVWDPANPGAPAGQATPAQQSSGDA
jgi:hypothetical protein